MNWMPPVSRESMLRKLRQNLPDKKECIYLRRSFFMKNSLLKFFIFILTAAFLLSSCAGIRLKTIPPSPQTAKLRIYVQCISAPFPYQGGTGQWEASHKKFAAKQIQRIERFLDKTGIYEVVSEQDVKNVLGDQSPSYIEMTRNNWKLAREIGMALYAEYVFVIERRAEKDGMGGVDQYFTISLINANSGKVYWASARLDTFARSDPEKMHSIVKNLYRTVFLGAKNDMFGTAIRKSETISKQDTELAAAPKPEPPKPETKITQPLPETKPEPKTPVKPAVVSEPIKSVESPKPEQKTTPLTPETKHQSQTKAPDKPVEVPEKKIVTAVPKPEHDMRDKNKLVIYDLDAPEQYKPVALILTEILREELFLLNRFILVNRENLLDVLREMALQQSGLIDEKQAVKAGKGLAANQVVTGSVGILVKTYLL
jgi:hypothetical protein